MTPTNCLPASPSLHMWCLSRVTGYFPALPLWVSSTRALLGAFLSRSQDFPNLMALGLLLCP